MKRNFTLMLLLVCASFMVKAQLPDGSIAPDFTATDIDGNTHTLYDYLDQGKTVVIDFMATWCGPCWSYHNTHATTDLWDLYGPDGTDEMVVLMIESDDDTELECLYNTAGCTGGTTGDWVSISPFPIIDDHTIGPNFDVGYYPTIYHICPNRIIVEAGQVSTDDLYARNGDCLNASGDNNAGILKYEGFAGSFCGSETFAPSVKFQNLGLMEMTSASFELWANGNMVETMGWTGSLTTYQFDDIVFNDITLTEATTLEIKITDVNGTTDEDDSNNSISVDITAAPVANSFYLTLELLTDNYGSETSWDVKDANGNTLASGSGYSNNTLYEEQIFLEENDCHTFNIYDSYGDGICCSFGQGSYKLLDPDGNVLFEGGEFADEFREAFEVSGAVGVKELDAVTGLSVFPNPVKANLNVQFNLTENMPLNVTVFNTLGQQVEVVTNQDFTVGSHTLNVDASNFSNGVYYVRFANGEKQLTSKFTVLK